LKGLRDFRDINTIVATKLGEIECEVTQIKSSKFEVTLKELKYMSWMWVNFFIINKAYKKGFKLSNDDLSIRLTKDAVSLCFDCIIPTVNDFVIGVEMYTIQPATTCDAMVNSAIN
jgi:hypothetical protein